MRETHEEANLGPIVLNSKEDAQSPKVNPYLNLSSNNNHQSKDKIQLQTQTRARAQDQVQALVQVSALTQA